MGKRFSVIIPCCENGSYLAETVKSVREQTFRDFECLLMYEESKDNTLALCKEAVAADVRFRLIEGPRSGSASVPRNVGVREAAGDYAVFVDGDDWLEANALERMNSALAAHGEVDVIAGAASEILEDEKGNLRFDQKRFNYLSEDDGKIFTGKEATEHIGTMYIWPYNAVWISVYRVSFLRAHKLEMIPGIIHEDDEWSPRVLFMAEKVLVMDGAFYNYRRHSSSIMGQLKVRDFVSGAAVMRAKFAFYVEHEREVSYSVGHVWQRSWLSIFYYIFFKPENQRGITEKMRRDGLRSIFSGDGKSNFRRFMRLGTLPKRVAAPLILLGQWWTWPACMYFKYIYYPLADRKGK